MYEPLNLQLTEAAFWVTGLFLLAGLAVVAHSLWRRRRYRSGADMEDTRYAGPDRGLDAGRELFAGVGLLVIAVGAGIFGFWQQNQQHEIITQNVAQKYGVEEVEGQGWRGNALVADITMPDGTVHEDVTILFADSGEPEISGGLPAAP